MAVIDSRVVGGVVREQWTDVAGGTYTAFDAAGQVVSTRAFTAPELAWLAEWQARQAERANVAALQAEARTRVADLLASMATLRASRDMANATINANPAAYIKGLANQLLVTDRALVAAVRVLVGVVDSTDTGTV